MRVRVRTYVYVPALSFHGGSRIGSCAGAKVPREPAAGFRDEETPAFFAQSPTAFIQPEPAIRTLIIIVNDRRGRRRCIRERVISRGMSKCGKIGLRSEVKVFNELRNYAVSS